MIFSWQQQQWAELQNRRERSALPHAILMSGPQGIGKLQFAEQFAASLFCRQPDAQGYACKDCSHCRLFLAESYPDYYHLQPEETGKLIKVDQVRSMIDDLRRTPQIKGYRVVIIEPAEALNIAAANALLKTLEEPGTDTLLILVSHQVARLTATIRSRCQQLRFVMPNNNEALQWLQSNQALQQEDAALLLQLASGAPLRAQAFAEQGDVIEHFSQLLQILVSSSNSAVQHAKQLQQGMEFRLIIEWIMLLLIACLRNAALQQVSLSGYGAGFTALQEKIVKLAPMKVYAFLDRLYQARRLINGPNNVNLQLLCEDLLIEWSKL